MSKRPIWQAAAAVLVAGNAELCNATNEIARYAITSGGGRSTSANLEVTGTIGQPVAGTVSTGTVTLSAGFWYGAAIPTDVADDGSPVPESAPLTFKLYQNVPNPFNPKTSIAFTLANPGHTTIRVFDLAGRRVTTLLDAELDAGHHRVDWNGRDAGGQRVASGIFYYQLRSGESGATGRMSLIK